MTKSIKSQHSNHNYNSIVVQAQMKRKTKRRQNKPKHQVNVYHTNEMIIMEEKCKERKRKIKRIGGGANRQQNTLTY